MDMQGVLEEFEVREDTLSRDEKAFLDENGYLPLPNILAPEQVRAFGARLDELARIEGDEAGAEVHQEAGATRLSDLINKDPMFEICFTHPRLLAAVSRVLQMDFKVHSLNFRAALPGQGLQALHADWTPSTEVHREQLRDGYYYVCNSIWLIDGFTRENGATRVVPGSHCSGKMPADEMEDPTRPHPDEVLLTAPAGTVVVFNGHTWHGGTLNASARPRRGMHSAFIRRDQPQQTNQKEYITPQTYERLSAAAHFIMDV